MARCPPGVICIENITILTVFILLLIGLGMFFYIYSNPLSIVPPPPSTPPTNIIVKPSRVQRGLFPRPSYSFSNVANDVLLNPYVPPLKDSAYFYGGGDIRGIPINIRTRGVPRDLEHRQVGILTRMNGPELILTLMGRPLYSNRSKWQYYTTSDRNIKLPVTNKQRSCTNEYGCDELNNGDSVYVNGYNDTFKVTLYDTNYPQYIPF